MPEHDDPTVRTRDLRKEQRLADLEQVLGERAQLLGDRDQARVDGEQELLDRERTSVGVGDALSARAFDDRQATLDRSQASEDAEQEALDFSQAGRDANQQSIDDLRLVHDLPAAQQPGPISDSQLLRDARERAGAARGRAEAALIRAQAGLVRAEASERRL